MWAKLLGWVSKAFLLPLLQELASSIMAAIKEYFARKKAEAENKQVLEDNKKKAEAYQNASSKDDARDSFDAMP